MSIVGMLTSKVGTKAVGTFSSLSHPLIITDIYMYITFKYHNICCMFTVLISAFSIDLIIVQCIKLLSFTR